MKSPARLAICTAGIYSSFLIWGLLQEQISTAKYGENNDVFNAPLVMNTIQSFLAFIVSLIYILVTDPDKQRLKNQSSLKKTFDLFQNTEFIVDLLFISITATVSSPIGYMSLDKIGYITFLLGKSCKLVPVLLVHVTIYKRKYPLYKFFIVAIVTFGIIIFTYFNPSTSSKISNSTVKSSSLYGLVLLSTNLFLDGVMNSAQDHMFHKFPTLTGLQMMCGLNLCSTIFTVIFMLSPFNNNLSHAQSFVHSHPEILKDLFFFGLCGAIGQLFIFYTLGTFGSLALVTITLTRKMFSMLLSVIWFGHKLTLGQWSGVFLVFGGISTEAYVKYLDKKSKQIKKN